MYGGGGGRGLSMNEGRRQEGVKTIQPTNEPTDRLTDRLVHRKVALPIRTMAIQNKRGKRGKQRR